MKQARDWIAKARSFHHRQLATPRKVIRLGKSRIVLTKGEAITSAGAFFAAGSVANLGSPDWVFWSVLLGGIFGGRFVFPIPDSSIASKRGPADVSRKNDAELDRMSPEEIRTYENNMVLKDRLKNTQGLGTAQALARQREAARAAEHVAAVAPESLSRLSVVEAQAFSAAAARHERVKSRWLAYEVDPHLQFDFPAMTDAGSPATAAMIRAMRAADAAKSAARAADYRAAVAVFSDALAAAEAAAGVPKK